MEIITEEVLLPFPARPAVRIPVSGEETLDVKSRSMIALQTQIYLTSIWEIFTLFFFFASDNERDFFFILFTCFATFPNCNKT